jgi:DNA-binding NarL/FixJ family response regulator
VSTPYSLLFVDDEPEILESLRRALRADGYELLTTTSPTEAIAILAKRHVDIIVTDLRMPDMSGLELVTHVRRMHPDVVRVLLTGFATLDSALEAINVGAVGRYLTKPWDNDELRADIQDVVRGIAESRGAKTASASTASSTTTTHAVLDAADLSPRLRETGAALMTGASEKQIASQLGLSPHTTHHYVKTLYRRFGVSSRAEFMATVGLEEKQEGSK